MSATLVMSVTKADVASVLPVKTVVSVTTVL